MSITPKNWNTFQHYKDRSPAWIKLHRGLLHDYAFSRLPVASRALAPMLWLLASEYENGAITGDFEEVAFKLHMTKGEFCEAINPLIEAGFFTLDSATLAARKQTASPEKRDIENIEKTEAEKNSSLRSLDDWPEDFKEKFWTVYPRKSGKQAAFRELELVRKRAIPWRKLFNAVAEYAATSDPKYTKHPKTWLHQGCWDDEPDTRKPHGKAPSAIISAADRLVAGAVAFGPKPSLMPGPDSSGAGAAVVRLLPDGRSERPGHIHSGDCVDLVRVPDGGGSARHGPEDGDCAQDQVPAVNSRS